MGKMGGARPGAGRKPGKVGAAKRALAEMAKEHAEAALRTLVDIARNAKAPAAARVSAATAILDRGYGKPAQSMMLSNPDGSNIMPTTVVIVAAEQSSKTGDDDGSD